MNFNKSTILNTYAHGVLKKDREQMVDNFFPETKPEHITQLEQIKREIFNNKVWEEYTNEHMSPNENHPFKYTHEELLIKAYSHMQVKKGNKVTDFTSSIMNLYTHKPNKHQLENGKKIEQIVQRKMTRYKHALPSENNDWKLVFMDPLNKRITPFKISSLTVNGLPLWGIPDLIFRNIKSDKFLIIERKASNREIPSNAWPNIPAQLWAYSKIDQLSEVKEIILVSEIWGNVNSHLVRRKVFRWSNLDSDFSRKNAELFQIYGGEIH